MPACEKNHFVYDNKGRVTDILPHEYAAGVCLTGHSTSTQSFLLAHYPYYLSGDYESSKRMCATPKTAPAAPQFTPVVKAPSNGKQPMSRSKARRERRKRALARQRVQEALVV